MKSVVLWWQFIKCDECEGNSKAHSRNRVASFERSRAAHRQVYKWWWITKRKIPNPFFPSPFSFLLIPEKENYTQGTLFIPEKANERKKLYRTTKYFSGGNPSAIHFNAFSFRWKFHTNTRKTILNSYMINSSRCSWSFEIIYLHKIR